MVLTLDEYKNQQEPHSNPVVLLKEGEYTEHGTRWNNKGTDEVIVIEVKGYPEYRYHLYGSGMLFWYADNGEERGSCFFINKLKK